MILFLHLFGYPVVAGRTPWGRRVFPSFVSPSLCPGVFLELDHEFFLNFGMVLETQMKRVAESDFLEKTFLAPKLRIWSTLGQTNFFEFIEKFGLIFYWICSIICSIFTEFDVFLHKSHIREKSHSWGVCQNAVSQLDCQIFKSTLSPEQVDGIAWFSACWYKFTKTKSWSKFFWACMIKKLVQPV